MAQIKKGDFIEIRYVGRIKDTNQVFDLNDVEVAKKENFPNPDAFKRKVIICVGERDVVEGLDNAFEGKDVGKSFDVDVAPEKGFGKRNAELFKLVPLKEFQKQNVNPYPGLQVDVDGMQGTVKTVNSGRIMVDFNHPLAGKELSYHVTPVKIISDTAEKVKGFIQLHLGLRDIEVTDEKGKLKIKMIDIPENMKDVLTKKIKERVKGIKEIKYEKKE